ncbi:hypothetical protein MTR67_031957 [Solanum verrucosum]|uniref:Uncharacterized protein n=1 Tax=Solanum verrucosum TaxID=315347 RepID=A0AAF0U3D5_SOLVR|nr:hypothetical protein MTR67_031957 [Solanum verrucosum]
MLRPHLARSFSLLFLFIVLLCHSSLGSTGGNRKTGKSSVFSLFNLKDRSKFWSESVIHGGDFDDLEASKPEKMSVLNYTQAVGRSVRGTLPNLIASCVAKVWAVKLWIKGTSMGECSWVMEALSRMMDRDVLGSLIKSLKVVVGRYWVGVLPTNLGLLLGNIANYLKLLEVDSMYLPVPVNFIFIGFEGKGNQEFKLLPLELERWFTKIDHILEHTRIPQVGEVLTPFYKTSIDREQRHHLPLISHINYNFSVHAIQMGEKVTSIFERAIDVFGRKDVMSDNRDDGTVLWQVDVDMIDVLYTSLVEYLQLEDAYNIFVLNPKRNGKRVKYGYRGITEDQGNLKRFVQAKPV